MNNFIRLGVLSFSIGIIALWSPYATAQMMVPNSDAQILKVMGVIDKNQIDLAKLAQERHIGRNVQQFARILDSDRVKNLDEVQELSRKLHITLPQENLSIGQWLNYGIVDLHDLTPLNHKRFSQEFLGDIISHDQKLLAWIDDQKPRSIDIKKVLRYNREQTETLLQKAQTIQKTTVGK